MIDLRGTKVSYASPKLYKSLGSLIKDYRHWRGVSQEYMSELIGISVRQLRNWEADRRRVRIENLHDLSEVTGIPMQVCVALNADQPLWYSLQKRWFAYSSVVAQSLPNELFRSSEKFDDNLTLKKEMIVTDKHYNMVLSCHHDIYRTLKPLRRDVVEKASLIIPDLNFMIIDSWGHYVGHSIWLPLEKKVYERLKTQKSFETFLTPEKISDIINKKEGVFLFVSSYISSLNVAYYKLIQTMRYFVEVIKKEKYIIGMYSAMTEAHELLSTIGMRIVGNYKQERSEIYNKLYETELDQTMRPGGPWNWLLEEHKIKENKALIGISGKIKSKKTNENSAIIVDNNYCAPTVDEVDQLLGRKNPLNGIKFHTDKNIELNNAACPNTACSLYDKKGKGNVISNGTYRRKGEKTGRRFLCKQCGKSFCNRTGTVFYDLRTPEEDISKALKLLSEGKPLSYVKDVMGVKFRTVRRWIKAASH